MINAQVNRNQRARVISDYFRTLDASSALGYIRQRHAQFN